MRVLGFASSKGGVGKTTGAVNFAYAAASRGLPTLLWDLDAQGAASYLLGLEARGPVRAARVLARQKHAARAVVATGHACLELLPADLSLHASERALADTEQRRRRISRILGELDGRYAYVVVDCPAGLTPLTERIARVADALLMPVIPTPLSVRATDQLRDALAVAGGRVPPLLTYFSMVDRRKRLHRELVEEVQLARPETLSATVPSSIDVERMAVRRAPLATYAPLGAAAAAFDYLWVETRARLDAPAS